MREIVWENPVSLRYTSGARAGVPYIRVAVHEPLHSLMYEDNCNVADTIDVKQIILQKAQVQLHITSELLFDIGRNALPIAWTALMVSLCHFVKSRSKHNFINRIKFIQDDHLNAITVLIESYVEQFRDLEYACHSAQGTFAEAVRRGIVDRDIFVDIPRDTLNSIQILIQREPSAFIDARFPHRGRSPFDTYFWNDTERQKSENRALKLLKSLVSVKDFKKYKKDGILTVKGKSGKIYRLQRHGMIRVYNSRRKFLYRLCIESRGVVPPTDVIIAKVKLINASESRLHKLARKFDGEF